MKGLKITKWILGVLCLLGFVFLVGDASVGVALNYFYNLNDGASTPPPGWTRGGGGTAQRVGNKLESSGGTIVYTRDVATDVAVSIEGVVSADNLPGTGDRGTRLWLALGDTIMFEHRLIEARLEQVAGGASKIVLRDAYDAGNPKGEIDLDWTINDPAIRVRLKRQNISGIDYIVLQGEVSKTGPGAAPTVWDDPANKNPDPDTNRSIKVPVSSFLTQTGYLNQIGFGNAIGGIYNSFWEYVLVSEANDAVTELPYWPPQPPAPVLTLITADPPHEVSSQVDLPIDGYLVNDFATLVLDTLSGKLSSVPIPDPSASPAQHIVTFTGLAGDQTVTGWVEITDVSGRTSIGPSASVELPPAGYPNIEVSPLEHDYGDIEIGTSVSTIITITNVGTIPLTVNDIGLQGGSSPDFSVTNAPALPAVLASGASVDVEVTYTPTATGYAVAVLEIASNDPGGNREVLLGGVGVYIEPPIATIDKILAFFDKSVGNGTLEGEGHEPIMKRIRLKAMRHMLVGAGTLIGGGYIEWACFILDSAEKRSDGMPRPPDLVVGEAVPELNNMIRQLSAYLGCK